MHQLLEFASSLGGATPPQDLPYFYQYFKLNNS